MGLTISDMNRMMYVKWVRQGMSHEEAIENIPEEDREEFIKDLKMSAFESHFWIPKLFRKKHI